MHEYTALLDWTRGDADFVRRRYSRAHTLRFDGGLAIPGSASPLVVRAPYSDAAAADPEELFVASLASCHMLWFLDVSARAGFVVERYADAAVGVMEPDRATGKTVITRVTLRPQVTWGGDARPTPAQEEGLHHTAHAECFIANSVRSEVRVEPRAPAAADPPAA